MLFIGGRGGGGICNVRYPGGAALVCLLAAVLCGSLVTVCPYPMSTAGRLFLWVLWRGENGLDTEITTDTKDREHTREYTPSFTT